MALELSIGVIIGFCILVFATVVFGLILLFYFIYNRIRNNSASKYKDLESDRDVKIDPDGSSWVNPVIEMEEIPDVTYNNNSLKRASAEETQYAQGGTEEETIIHSEEVEFQQPIIPTYQNVEATPAPLPEPEEVSDVPDNIAIGVEDDTESVGRAESPVDEPEDLAKEDDPPKDDVSDIREPPGYATVGEVVLHQEQPQPEQRPKVGKLGDRISVFEEKYQQSSLIRSTRKPELEGIQSKVVSNLVTEYEASDNVFLGRQLTDEPAMIMSTSSTSGPKAAAAGRSPSFNNQQASNDNQPNSSGVSSEDVNRQSYLDADTGEPLYSQPDLTKKLSRKSKRDSAKVSFAEDVATIEDNPIEPGVPPKDPDM